MIVRRESVSPSASRTSGARARDPAAAGADDGGDSCCDAGGRGVGSDIERVAV